MKDRESVIELVRKCLALSKSSNENEAALALARAQEILFKYNLSLEEVEREGDNQSKKSSVTQSSNDIRSPKNHGKWKRTLLNRICRYNFCDLIIIPHKKYESSIIIGQPHNIEVVKELYNWIVEQIERFCKEACKSYYGPDRIPTFRRSFLEAAAITVGNRLYKQFEQSRKASEASTALVVKHQEQIQEYVDREFPDLRTGKRHQGGSSLDGHRAGIVAGNSVNLSPRKRIE